MSLSPCVRNGLDLSPITTEVLIEESIIGWKEYEMEVMRDGRQRRDHLLDRELRRRWASTPATRSRLRLPRR